MVDALLPPAVGGIAGLAAWRLTGRPMRPRPRGLDAAAAAAMMLVGSVFGLPAVTVVGSIAVCFVSMELKRRAERARDQRREAALPVVVDAMVQRLRSGSGLRVVCAAPTPADPEFDDVLAPLVDGLTRQRPLREAIGDLQLDASRRERHDVQLFAATLAALVDRAGPAVPALQRLRLTLMGSVEARARAGAQAGQARASAALLTGAPALFAVLVAVADADVGRFYLREPLGVACAGAALLLSYAGWRWMNREVDRALGYGGHNGRRRGRRQERIRERCDAVAPTVDLIAMTVGAGGTPADGVELAAEQGPPTVRSAFAEVIERRSRGELLVDALPALTERLGPDYHPLVTALVANEQGGAPVGALLQRLASEAEQARRRSVDLALARLPVRLLVPLVACQLPAVIVGAVLPLTIVALRHLRG